MIRADRAYSLHRSILCIARQPFVGDAMIKLIASALLCFGIAAAVMAADTPSSTGSSASAPAASSSASKSAHKKSGKTSKTSKKSTPAPPKS
jgi:predicted naringenin-chalcone synthase